MTQKYVVSREPNLMGYYFPEYSSVFKVAEQLRIITKGDGKLP